MKYYTVDNWNGESDLFDTVDEAVAHAEEVIKKIRLTQKEFEKYEKNGENYVDICSFEVESEYMFSV